MQHKVSFLVTQCFELSVVLGNVHSSLQKSFSFRLCLSITDFHPDTWNPAWSVSTILTGLLSFMVEKGPTLGSIETSDFTVRCGSASPGALWFCPVPVEISALAASEHGPWPHCPSLSPALLLSLLRIPDTPVLLRRLCKT